MSRFCWVWITAVLAEKLLNQSPMQNQNSRLACDITQSMRAYWTGSRSWSKARRACTQTKWMGRKICLVCSWPWKRRWREDKRLANKGYNSNTRAAMITQLTICSPPPQKLADYKPGRVTHSCSSNPQGVESEKLSWVRDQPWFHREYKASQVYRAIQERNEKQRKKKGKDSWVK